MKTFLLAATALTMIAAPVMAADMPLKAPAFAPAYNWTGFYVGGDAGGVWDSQTATATGFPSPGFGAPAVVGAGLPGFGLLPTTHNLNGDTGLANIRAGYNYQFSSVVVGVEGDLGLFIRKRQGFDSEPVFETFAAPFVPAFEMTVRASNRDLASIRGRLGWAWDRLLVYGTGGPAWTDTTYTAIAQGLTNGPVTLPGVGAIGSVSDSKTGYVAGAGFEYVVSNPNWIVRVEYLHYGFGGDGFTLPLVVPPPPGGAPCGPGACNWAISASRLDFNSITAGMTFKFGS
jgi:outer membrane immunogenic protein